jgi:Ca-activated chloride channel family protein
MVQAKQALRLAMQDLSVNDRFNIVDFDSHYRPLFAQPKFATGNNIALGNRMIDRLQADGGTEMRGALQFALSQPGAEEYLQQIIFITDGSIGNEQELLSLIDQQLGDARLFTVAIGTAPNTYFMRKAARFGRGFYQAISDLNQVSEQMQLLTQRIKRPLLRDIKLEWAEGVEQYPARVPDLYAGEPIVVVTKSSSPVTKVKVAGQLASQRWTQSLQQTSVAKTEPKEKSQINTLWARAKIEHLMETLITAPQQLPQIREQVIALAIAHQLTSKFTSFVAVEQAVSRPEGARAKHENVPNLMPRGSTMIAPQTATAADLLKLLGVLCLCLAFFWRRGSEFRWPATME